MCDYIAQRISEIPTNIKYIFYVLFYPNKVKELRKKEVLSAVGSDVYAIAKKEYDQRAEEEASGVDDFRKTMIWGVVKMIIVLVMAIITAIGTNRCFMVQPKLVSYIRLFGVCLVFMGVAGKVGIIGLQSYDGTTITERANGAWNRYLYFAGIYISLTTSILLS